jgi:FAD/FMN-containing dehydrogenase
MSLEGTLQLQSTSLMRELRARFDGRLIGPNDAEYDDARAVFYGGFDRRPAAIIRASNAADVSAAIQSARDTDLPLAIRGGGHSFAGHSVIDDGIVLDLANLRALQIDVEGRTAWAQAGLTAGEYTNGAGAHGLATGFGDAASVGIGGLTLGGGVGYLVRKHGLTIDQLLAAEIVTADGQLVRTDAGTHPDLFWAIRGGGGNFGVVTRFQFRLHELESVTGGMLILPASPDVVHQFVTRAEEAPEELSTIANIMLAPPLPFVPAEHHGKLVLMGLMAYAGAAEDGEAVIAPFRALASPIVDMIRPIPYSEIYPPEQPGFHPIAVARTLFVDALDRSTAERLVDRLNASTAPMPVTQLRVLGGAAARVPSDATAYAHRSRRIMVNVAILYQDLGRTAEFDAWVADLADELRNGDPGAYVNFLGDEGEARVRDAYPGKTWDRLVTIKRHYDPTNLFRVNHNISASHGGVR